MGELRLVETPGGRVGGWGSLPVDVLRDRLDAGRPAGQRYGRPQTRHRCPAHLPDRDPSLYVAEGDDGTALLLCRAGCTTRAICDALGIDMADLFPPSDRTRHRVVVPLRRLVRAVPAPPEPGPVDDAYLSAAHELLKTSSHAEPARAYLGERGVTADDVDRYRLGLGFRHDDRDLAWLTARVVFGCPYGSAEGRLVAGLARHTRMPQKRYVTVGPKTAWGIDAVQSGDPVVLVEGIFDRIAVERFDDALGGIRAIALRGLTAREHDLDQLRRCGAGPVFILLDAEVPIEKRADLGRQILDAGLRPVHVRGLDRGDLGDLLTLPADEHLAELEKALRDR